MIIKKLFNIIKQRQRELPKKSYVASLFQQGEDRIIQKVGEEAVEVIIAAKCPNTKKLIEEIADLFFMTFILLASKNISLEEIWQELGKRNKGS